MPLFYVAVTEDVRLDGVFVVAHELLFAFAEHYPVGCFDGGGVARALFLSLHVTVEGFVVEGHALLFEDELGEVEGEAVGVVEREGFVA